MDLRALLTTAAMAVTAVVGAPASPTSAAADALTDQRLTTHVSPATGYYDHVRADDGVLVEDDTTAPPATRALRFLATFGGPLGLSPDEREAVRARAEGGAGEPKSGSALVVRALDDDMLGGTHVRLAQRYRGLPVRGAELVVNVGPTGVRSVAGTFVPGVAVDASVTSAPATVHQTALGAVRKASGVADVRVVSESREVFRTGMLEGRYGENRLAHVLQVEGEDVAQRVHVDAATGRLLTVEDLRHAALDRCVYSPTYEPSQPDLFRLRREGSAPTMVPPVDNLYDFAGQVHGLFDGTFGRDSYDAAGAKMISVYLINGVCPNAYWNGQSTNYCPGFDTDDIVAHEWGHAYTERTAGLIYQWQPGALNESYSDIWGEVVDLLNGRDGLGGSNNTSRNEDPASDRWWVGEDLEQSGLFLRDMWDPESIGYPAQVSSANYTCDEGMSDGGGVHTNSSIPNHAFAMLVDGKKFDGQTVTGIGLDKAAHVHWRALTAYETPSTDFAQHALALDAACADLVGVPVNMLTLTQSSGGTVVLTAEDCAQVRQATLVTEMHPDAGVAVACDFDPVLVGGVPERCAGAASLLHEDWEGGLPATWTTDSAGVFPEWPDYTWSSRGALPDDRAGAAAFAFNDKGGTCAPGGDYSGTFGLNSPDVIVPDTGSVVLRFDHYVATEAGYDGGDVRLSINDGPYEPLPPTAYLHNPPNAELESGPPIGQNTNPNAGRPAWTGVDEGEVTGSWGTTVAQLDSLVEPGDKLRIRFEFGIDGCNGVDGWYVDDVSIDLCPALEPPSVNLSDDYSEPDGDGQYTLSWTPAPGSAGSAVVQESTFSGPPPLADDAEQGARPQWSSEDGSLARWTTSETKPQHASTAFHAVGFEGWDDEAVLTTRETFTVPLRGTTLLSFDEWFVNEPDDMGLVEVLPVTSEPGAKWTEVHRTARAETVDKGARSFATEGLARRTIDLTGYAGQDLKLRFRYVLGSSNYFIYTPYGWYVDNIRVDVDDWQDVAVVDGTSWTATDRGTGTYHHRVRHGYTDWTGRLAYGPPSNVVTAKVLRTEPEDHPDLVVRNVSVNQRSGEDWTVRATVTNDSGVAAGASVTEFVLDGSTVVARVPTPALEPGSSYTATASWSVRGVEDGRHELTAIADRDGQVQELSEDNNRATRQVQVKERDVGQGRLSQS